MSSQIYGFHPREIFSEISPYNFIGLLCTHLSSFGYSQKEMVGPLGEVELHGAGYVR